LSPEEALARIELRALVDDYAYAIDTGDAQLLESLFLPDGRLRIGPQDADPVVEWVGAAEIPGVFDRQTAFIDKHHLMANHRCRISDDRATGQVYALCSHLVRSRDGSTENVNMALVYDDCYERTDDGWKFASRCVRQVWRKTFAVQVGVYGLSAE
jgi:ketosteroid isomerase-like protein